MSESQGDEKKNWVCWGETQEEFFKTSNLIISDKILTKGDFAWSPKR